MKLRVLTWNVHKCIGGVDRKYRPERVVEVIAHYAPDIALLQEVDEGVKRSSFHRQVDHLGDALGMRHRGYGPNVKVGLGRYGNAILSRWPLFDVRNHDLTLRLKKRRGALFARCRVRRGKRTRTIVLYNLHLALAGFERKTQLQRLIDALPHHARTPVVLGGDFNDVWGSLGRKILEPAGFERAGSLLNTFPAILPARPLDGVYVRGDIDADHVYRARLKLAREASDHLPLIADLELTMGARRYSKSFT